MLLEATKAALDLQGRAHAFDDALRARAQQGLPGKETDVECHFHPYPVSCHNTSCTFWQRRPEVECNLLEWFLLHDRPLHTLLLPTNPLRAMA